jgi:CTP:molybdopterin cytidylyltransferase MocA
LKTSSRMTKSKVLYPFKNMGMIRLPKLPAQS